MKKVFLLMCLMATTVIASATDVWEGEHAVNWGNTLTIEKGKFTDMKVGDKLVIEFKDATGEVIELHSNGRSMALRSAVSASPLPRYGMAMARIILMRTPHGAASSGWTNGAHWRLQSTASLASTGARSRLSASILRPTVPTTSSMF